MAAFRALLWTLGGLVSAFLMWRLLRLAIWLALRPGGWAVLVFAVLLAVKISDDPAVAEHGVPALAGAGRAVIDRAAGALLVEGLRAGDGPLAGLTSLPAAPDGAILSEAAPAAVALPPTPALPRPQANPRY